MGFCPEDASDFGVPALIVQAMGIRERIYREISSFFWPGMRVFVCVCVCVIISHESRVSNAGHSSCNQKLPADWHCAVSEVE